MIRTSRLALVVAFLVSAPFVAAAPASAAAAGAGTTGLVPRVQLTQAHVAVRTTSSGMSWTSTVSLAWSPSRAREVELDSSRPRVRLVDEQRGLVRTRGILERGVHARHVVDRGVPFAQPDGVDLLDARLMQYAWPIIARVRAGSLRLVQTRLGGRAVLRARLPLGASTCAGLRAGTRTVFFDPSTLVPLRVQDSRPGHRMLVTASVRRARPAELRPIAWRGRGVRMPLGVRAATPAAAARQVAVPIAMPAELPAGFRLAQTGWAPRGWMLGPEGLFPTSRGVFAATWRRGLEPLHLTIRGARATLAADWDQSDPFGVECAHTIRGTLPVGDATARWSIGEEGLARIWWRDGSTLYTLAGALAPEQLAVVARSLQPIAG